MPWTKKQQKVARAVEHGWKPKGEAKGFTTSLAEKVLEESERMPTRPAVVHGAKKRAKAAEDMLGKGARIAAKR